MHTHIHSHSFLKLLKTKAKPLKFLLKQSTDNHVYKSVLLIKIKSKMFNTGCSYWRYDTPYKQSKDISCYILSIIIKYLWINDQLVDVSHCDMWYFKTVPEDPRLTVYY